MDFVRNHLVTTGGVIRCRFELFIRWPDNAGRKLNPFTQRGDSYNITEPDKMLRFLLQYFIKKHQQWRMCELYDNTHPLNDRKRIILEFKNKSGCLDEDEGWETIDLGNKIIRHRLHDYQPMLYDFPFPTWLIAPTNR